MKRNIISSILSLTALAIAVLTPVNALAQITIGGDVYGGGKEGAVNTDNTTATSETAQTAVTLTSATSDATSVFITEDAEVRTVFGGGRNGRCYGQTNVTMDAGTVGAEKWQNTIHGGIFGAGDGSSAWVFGKENSVLIKGGTIYNNVYGGGNEADLMGCTKVTLQDGTYYGSVFGGARMANIYGHSFVNLDGKNVPDNTTLIVPTVYGGNDVAGTIAVSDNWDWTKASNIDISQIPITVNNSTYAAALESPINNTWNAFVVSTYKDIATNNIFVGNLYGGGNGDYTYTDNAVSLNDLYTDVDSYNKDKATTLTSDEFDALSTTDLYKSVTYSNLSKPELAKDYLNLQGGTFGYVYGGGNNATVTESTDILVWDAHFTGAKYDTPVMASIPKSRIADTGMLESMFTITGEGDEAVATPSYQIDRIFGGNNKAAMSIQPHWYLAQGTFNNIYSGGNKGDMTCPTGILLNIGSRSVFANNVYGGCRMADVHPKDASGNTITTIAEQDLAALKVKYDTDCAFAGLDKSTYTFEKDYPARVYITGGHINNVYGGNDISGRVYLGTNVAIAGAISGNVYGGGNGSYAYTDNATLGSTTEYADLYYAPGSSSIDALNAYRPHVDNTLLHIWGNENQQPSISDKGIISATDADGNATTEQPVIVTGGVYCGGNSATIESSDGKTPTATFNIGKNVIINSVFLGSNGENMVTSDILAKHAGSVTVNSVDCDYSTFDLTDKTTFATYMNGCAVNIMPTVTYDWATGEDPHTYIGSLYGGGNVGSVTYNKPITLDMPEGLIIYDRVVGGCNNADVAASTYNAAFEGGMIGKNTDTSKPKIIINMDSQLEPRELNVTKTNGFLSSAILYWDVRNYYGLKYDSTTDKYSTDKTSVFVDDAGTAVDYASVPWLPYDANVFGGCYTSGHIAGDVQINVTKDIISRAMLKKDGPMTESVATACNKSTNWVHLGEYVFAKTMSIYGGGFGEKTYIAGDTHINLSNDARVINVLGGADFGTIGCPKTDLHEAHVGNCYVTVATDMTDYSTVNAAKNVDANDTHLPYNVTKIYGGAYAGTIYGHTELRLNGGSYQQAYAGSCNADIADYASLYLGTKETANSGYPYVYLYAFGGNDFGGYIGRDGSDNTKTALLAGTDFDDNIKGYHDFTSTDGQAGYGDKTVRTTRYVEYNSGRVGYQYDSSKSAFNEETGEGNYLSQEGSQRSSVYGGSYGSYDYSLKYISWDYLKDPSGTDLQTDFDPASTTFHYPLMKEYIPTADNVFVTNTYVNVPCASTNANKDVIQRGIFAGGRGIMEQTNIVDAGQTYVYLHGANWQSRNANLSSDIFGGGYYSIVENTKVDAKTGCTSIIYGGSYGTSAKNLNTDALKDIHYNSTNTEVNLYDGMDNSNMMVFGGGGYAGSTTTNVNLYGGMAENVYGGSYNEGYCETTHVNVPDATNTVTSTASTAKVNAIFGGGYGNDVTLPCDENETNVTFSSATAYVTDGVIYGGNNAKRAAKTTNVTINTPVKTGSGATDTYVSVCGAGNGACTVAGFTNVTLNSGAQVNNVYGGGRDGKVFGFYKNISAEAQTYYDSDDTYNPEPTATKRHGYADWIYSNANNSDGSWEGTSMYTAEVPASGTDLFGYYTKSGDVYTACYSGTTADGTTTYYKKISSTTIIVNKGATAQNIYGGGYGADATVAGSTRAHNHGGTITGDMFGGGLSGNVVYQKVSETATDPATNTSVTLVEKANGEEATFNNDQIGNIYTYVCNFGGSVTNMYGGGYKGQVGSYHNDTYPAESRVEIGEDYKTDFYAGCPIVKRSVYGGGYSGAIYGTAKIQMYNGFIGYNYDTTTDKYTENLAASADDTNSLLKESGNVFGAGYGEGATTDHTIVNMHDGTVRNSLYGGGEIASVGVADLNSIDMTDRTKIPNITVAGSTQVNLYGGLVSSNVFGGGRGYAIDAYGKTTTGEKGYSDGYTFGKTNVNIYRGTVGTDATLAEGNGNVFGGGNIGYIYGADGTITDTYKNVTKGSDGYYHIGTGSMSEDSKVLVTPVCKALVDGTVNGNSYKKGDIVSHEELDKITSATEWETYSADTGIFGSLDKQGVIIRNAVFAGGNVSSGSDKVYANTKTIYGNATASIVDCLGKDLVTIGADDIGGLYGDGNLTFVDGYRELCIKNYGTDYYSLNSELSYEQYQKLNERERAYFELKYVCNTEYTGEDGTHAKDSKISSSEYEKLPDSEKSNWTLAGFCTLYAGRMLNTIQRADFCGVHGSRVVLKGAQDRVPTVVDYTKYTINRIGELSLNQVDNANATDGKNGNYFGIYNVVNYLGALTSDVKFTDTRTSESSAYPVDDTYKTYWAYKNAKYNTRGRNNGTSKNKVALASGVWLEVVKQTATSSSDKDVYGIYTYKSGDKIYGPITGVVELDLINAATGEGGGYVYALNQHGTQSESSDKQTTLTAANDGAVSYKQYTYDTMSASDNMETSGNFISSDKRIVDDCYPNNSTWLSTASPTSAAHYWFIRGDYYVYDQYISAYTGAAQSYAQSVNIPLTITAQNHGKLRLLNIQDNFNANWTTAQYTALDSKYKVEGDPSVIVMNGKSYSQNSPISYWDYSRLTSDERAFFTDGTYVCSEATGDYKKGDVITSTVYSGLTDDVKAKFNVTNALNSDNGFLLTYSWANPKIWGNYYIKPDSQSPSDMITEEKKGTSSDYSNYMLSPTYKYTGTESKIYGQKDYEAGQLVSKTVVDSEPTTIPSGTATQAAFEVAYVAKEDNVKVTWGGQEHYYVKGGAISVTNYATMSDEDKAKFDVGYTCINTYKVSEEKYYITGDVITATEYTALSSDIQTAFAPSYICTTAGAYGGKLFEAGKNYEALYYSGLDATERENFSYNLDALDLLQAQSDPSTKASASITNYVNTTAYKALGNEGSLYKARHTELYGAEESIDYTATYTGDDDLTTTNAVTVNGSSTNTVKNGDVLTRDDFENKLANEPANYSLIAVQASNDTYYDDTNKRYYIVNSTFWVGEACYSVGKQVAPATYENMTSDQKANITAVSSETLRAGLGDESIVNYYFCNNSYTAATAVASPVVGDAISAGNSVSVGTIISKTDFGTLKNEQANFELTGSVPVETSTLYVSPSADINSLSQDKIMTVVYEYSYVESTEDATAYEAINERHIVNVRVHFESGVPTVGTLLQPETVLPGNAVSLNQPSVSQGAYEILGGGWEIYTNEIDAQNHTNGQAYTNNNTKMYWYQNGYQVAYYAKTYLGKTYSNSVPITVANYHRMSEVMANGGDSDGLNGADYMYLNEAGKNSGIRDSKVYVKDASELDQMKQFFDLTKGGNTGFESIANCANIDFIIDGDIDHTATWSSIGDADNCFSGNIHGDGHTISGLDHSLLGSLCGNVYNLGVTGSYTGSGVTDAGDGNAYNCWVVTTGAVTDATKPIHGGTGATTNCYYYNDYGTREGTTKSELADFIDGKVAYDLNSYYLKKRECDALTSGTSYSYWKVADVGTTTGKPSTAYYPSDYKAALKYVESRYDNEDFIYADGVIPQTDNIRKYSGSYYPVYPDDYIFFGQKLTYGIISGTASDSHVNHPQTVKRITNSEDEALNTKLLDTDLKTANRVYRAPGYHNSKTMGEAVYYNKPAAFVDAYTMPSGNIYNVTTATDLPYKNLTAIDFTGYNDASKILDYEGLTAFATSGLTRNLLVYADPTNDATSYSVLATALPEATLTMNAAAKDYNEVAVPTDAAQVKGHLVDKTDDSYKASRNHFLVDKEVFNCPISYTFDADSKMWYQRKPDNCVNSATTGWEAISLPFTADIVSTQTKGEITHFYNGSETGHEYWLRTLESVGTKDANGKETEGTVYANFSSLANNGSDTKTDGNTFLWDYYYSNSDGSHQEYYNSERTYANYPLYTAAVPYIIGFPGSRFYEFDMSGSFEPAVYSGIDKIAAQTVSFLSEDGATVGVSDDELKAVTANGYSYVPNYSEATIAAGSYFINSTGSGFDKTTAAQAAVPFRPYFKPVTNGNAKQILFCTSLENIEDKGIAQDVDGKLSVYVKKNAIFVESSLKDEQTVTITNVNGVTINRFTINNGDIIETPIYAQGVYIINSTDASLRGKKLNVR